MEIKERLGLAQKISESKGEKATEFKDSLARMVKSDFDAAVRHRSMHKFGDYTAEEVLQNCYAQYYGEVPCDIREAFGNMPMPSLTQLKVSALNAWIRDLLFGSGGTPFTVEPTPIPELNKEIEDEVLYRVKEVIFGEVETVLPTSKLEWKS